MLNPKRWFCFLFAIATVALMCFPAYAEEPSYIEPQPENRQIQNAAHAFFLKMGWSEEQDSKSWSYWKETDLKLTASQWQKANAYAKQAGLSGASKFDPDLFYVCHYAFQFEELNHNYTISLFIQCNPDDYRKIDLAGIQVATRVFKRDDDGLFREYRKSWVYPANMRKAEIDAATLAVFEKQFDTRPTDLAAAVFLGGMKIADADAKDRKAFLAKHRKNVPEFDFIIPMDSADLFDNHTIQAIQETVLATNQVLATDIVELVFPETQWGNFCIYSRHRYYSKKHGIPFYVEYYTAHRDDWFWLAQQDSTELIGWLCVKPVVTGSKAEPKQIIYPINASLNQIADDMNAYLNKDN